MSNPIDNNKKLIYLLDLAHMHTVDSESIPVPLGIGYVNAYLDKKMGDRIKVKMFKDPQKLLNIINKDRPEVVALANYGWNENLNSQIGKYIRKIFPKILMVCGGPNMDLSIDQRKVFLQKFNFLDFAIIDGGEAPFAELIEWWVDGSNVKNKLPDNLIWLEDNMVMSSPLRPQKKEIDDIPSPYLGGYLDEFLDQNMVPLFETNRGCPFKCTFCAWGMASHNLVRRFELSTAIEEIRYVGARSKARNWIICDANFGLLPRDVEIARELRKVKEQYGFLKSCNIWLAKNVTERNLEIAEILGDMVIPVMAVQSMDEKVLENIKRSNINIETYTIYHKKFHKLGSTTYSDLIVPLPEETLSTHIKAISQLMHLNVDIIQAHNMRLLAGAETNSLETRKKYDFQTKFRLIHGDAGRYQCLDGDEVKSFEYEESLRQTSTMSEKDVFYLRKLHFLLDFCWNNEVYKPVLRFVGNHNIDPVKIFRQLIDYESCPELKDFWQQFESMSNEEWFDSAEEIENYFSNPDNFKKLINLEFDKLNILFSVRILKDYKQFFDLSLLKITQDLLPNLAIELENIMQIMCSVFPPLTHDKSEIKLSLAKSFVSKSFNKSSSEKIKLFEDEKRKLAKNVILNSGDKTLSKILNTQDIRISHLRYTINQSYGSGAECMSYLNGDYLRTPPLSNQKQSSKTKIALNVETTV